MRSVAGVFYAHPETRKARFSVSITCLGETQKIWAPQESQMYKITNNLYSLFK
jgi:hypothetical protein